MECFSTFKKIKNWLKGVLWICIISTPQQTLAQEGVNEIIPKAPATRSINNSVPSGYKQVGSTLLYYQQSSSSIDIIGTFDSRYYGSTYSNRGYKVAMKVGSNSAINVDCLNGTTNNGVIFAAAILEQGELARICYTLTNTNDEDVLVSLGIHADVMIGNNDRAPISRRVDSFGNTYGLTLKDGNGAQLCALFGAGLSGVTSIDSFWFGQYSLNSSASAMVGNYSSGGNYMVENGSYDSGLGWCWKNRTIAAGSTMVFSWLIGVGDVNLEPSSSFEVTPDDPDGWNDLSRPHRLTLDGLYESPAGLSGVIDYAVEDSEEWIALTDTLESGDTFRDTLVATFSPNKEKHIIRFRTRDLVGNTTLLPPIEYLDVSYYPVSNILDKTYCGDSLFQTELTCNLDASQYVTKNYANNLNAGVASFNVEGVFPHTIGRKTYTFTIHPATLEGDVLIADSNFVYNGYPQMPEWSFTESANDTLDVGVDYDVVLSDNLVPGEGTLAIMGKGNYTGVLSSTFTIDKAPLTGDLYQLELPQADITYDGLPHGASISVVDGVGETTLYYATADTEEEYSTEQPSRIGSYNIFLEIADGTLFYGKPMALVGSFTIYQFDENEWQLLQSIHTVLQNKGWKEPWDMTQGIAKASTFDGLTIKEGHVIGINLSNINLSGEFPIEILSFPQLQEVNLSNNSLSGKADNVAMFAMKNPGLMQHITDINITNNQISGNIGLFALAFPNLETLKASENKIEDVYPMISPKVSVLELASQKIERVLDIHLKDMNVEALAPKTPTILLYNHSQQAYTLPVDLHCTTVDGWGFVLSYRNDQISVTCASEDNVYRGMSGDTLSILVNDDYGAQRGTTLRMKLSFDEGDANFDGKVDILDLQTTLNYMFEEYTNKPYNFTASNLWKDEDINVQDAVCLVNMLLDANAVPAHQLYATTRVATQASEISTSVTIENGYLKIKSVVPVSAFDITVSTSHQAEVVSALNDLGFICTSKQSGNNLHLVGYSLSGAEIPAGETAICELNSGIVSSAMLADRNANEISATLDGDMATGVQISKFNPSSQEVYRIPLGAKRAIIIDATGKKIMIKDEK